MLSEEFLNAVLHESILKGKRMRLPPCIYLTFCQTILRRYDFMSLVER